LYRHGNFSKYRDGDVKGRPCHVFVSVVDAAVVEVVIQVDADCLDRARAEADLAAALAGARGPRRSAEAASRWRLDVKVAAAAPGVTSAEASIRDDTGRVVAERTVNGRTTKSCVALARAVGAWAQIVLDDELAGAHESYRAEGPPGAGPPWVMPAGPPASDGKSPTPRPAPEGPSRGAPFEVGTTLFLRNGVASTGGIFGASPFVTIGVSRAFVVRPSLLVGTSTSRVPPDSSRSANLTALGGRLDFCRRMPGNYIDRRGIELDACAGADVAYVASDLRSAVRASVGPSAILRGELGANFGLEIRGMLGANLARAGLGADAPFFVAAAELGGSVRFR
jgi:hypothetical protein